MIEQMAFGELFARGRRFLEIEHGTYQALRRYRRAVVSQRLLANHGGQRRAGGVAANHELVRHRCRAILHARETHLVAAIASSMAAGNVCSGCKPIVHRHEAAAGCLRQRRGDQIMGLDTAADHAAAVEEDKTRQRFARHRLPAHRAGTEYRPRGRALRRRNPGSPPARRRVRAASVSQTPGGVRRGSTATDRRTRRPRSCREIALRRDRGAYRPASLVICVSYESIPIAGLDRK